MPHSSDFGWTERKHESNGCENGGRRGGGRWARGQLSPAAGPPGACTARGGPQDACSDQGDHRVGLPRTRAARVEPGARGASPATRLPGGRAGPASGRRSRLCGRPLPLRSFHAAGRLRRSGRRRTSGSSQSSGRSARTTAAPGHSSPSNGFGTSPACEDVRVPLIRRPGPIGLALTALEVWRRLPPEQRRQLMDATRKQAPRAAAAAHRVLAQPPAAALILLRKSRIRFRGSATREDP